MMLKSSLAREGPLFGEQQRVGLFECIAGCLAAVLETVCGEADLGTKERGCGMDVGELIQQALLSIVC